MPPKAILSKSTFLKGLQCDKHLYLYKHHYPWQDKISKIQQAVFDRGHRVGDLAHSLFPGGIDAKPSSPRAYAKAVEYTSELIEEGIEVIYEAAFIYNEVLVYADILVKNGSKWKIYEVKSSTSISETNINDISLQYYVIDNGGLEIEDFSLIYINNEFVRFGDLDLNQFFNIESLLPYAIEKQDEVSEEIERLKNVVRQKEIPDIEIGMQCTNPYQCSFYGHCWKHIPKNSVFDISRMHLNKKFELYYAGVVSIKDIPDDYILPDSQQLQVDSLKSGERYIDYEAIKEFITSFRYPLYFMDFESFQPAIPLYDNSKPYQQIPFQYSLHYKNNEGSELEHKEFLSDPTPDPRIPFIEKLLADTRGEGEIVVYNSAFEITRLKEIARDFPEFEIEIGELISRIIDLMVPFQKKWFYTPEMQGSYSIKKVLPALLPEMNYDELDISDGASASLAFESLIDEQDLIEISKIRSNLLHYCKLDTLAMVEIFNKLREIVE